MRVNRKGGAIISPAIVNVEAAVCRYCDRPVRRQTLEDGRILTVNAGGCSHWLTCAAVSTSGGDDNGEGAA